jgi:hypothetical protein
LLRANSSQVKRKCIAIEQAAAGRFEGTLG